MTELLEKAIAEARRLPPTAQDELAEMIMMITSMPVGRVELDAETRAAVEDGLGQARRGMFATDERVASILRRT